MNDSLIYERLRKAPKPIFGINSDDIPYFDEDIVSISVNHGKSSTEAGYEVATMSYTCVGKIPVRSESPTSLTITKKFATWVEQVSGFSPNILRFDGRSGTRNINDLGDHLEEGKFTTEVSASSWVSILKKAKRTFFIYGNTPLNEAIIRGLNHPNLPYKFTVTSEPSSMFDVLAENKEFNNLSELLDSLARDKGIFCVQRSNGDIHIMPILTLIERVNTQANTMPSILRSQVLSSAKWVQPLDGRGGRVIAKKLTDQGAVQRVPFESLAQMNRVQLEEHEEDWSDVKTVSDNWLRYMKAANYRLNLARLGVESITVDLSILLSSENEYDLQVAGYLLTLEQYSPVYLGGDWPSEIRGAYVAIEISEDITPDSWLMTINLGTLRNTLGVSDNEYPVVPPRVWNQLTTETWDNQGNKRWDDF